MPGNTARLDWPLMANNITTGDLDRLMEFLGQISLGYMPRLTQGREVEAFEQEFSRWLGCRHAVMVNSGSSANLITIAALRQVFGQGHVIVPAITWSSDIASILHAGMTPLFVDVHPETLGMDPDRMLEWITDETRAVFVTHCLGFSALPTGTHADVLRSRRIQLIEDCCEATGAYAEGRNLGTFGLMSNFSFYYAHHMSTIEGGMVCTDSRDLYEILRRLRSHGLTREMTDKGEHIASLHPDLDPQFIFEEPAWNLRSTELNAVLGRAQLKRLDLNNGQRSLNLKLWLGALDPDKYRTKYATYGSSNYALPLVLAHIDAPLMKRVLALLQRLGVEYRRGTAGGGNQLRQPYVRRIPGMPPPERFPQAEHVHHFGLYIGNFPDLEPEKIETLAKELNAL